MRYCLQPGCPELVDKKASYCEPHDPWKQRPAWQNPRTQAARPSGWERGRIRERVLRRDRHRCVECGRQATEVDHIVPVARAIEQGINADAMDNLRSLCVECHAAKTERDRIEGMRLSRERKKR